MPKLRAHQINPEGDNGDVPTIEAGSVVWQPSGYREVLMASGVSFPAEPLESSGGGDWLYSEVIR